MAPMRKILVPVGAVARCALAAALLFPLGCANNPRSGHVPAVARPVKIVEEGGPAMVRPPLRKMFKERLMAKLYRRNSGIVPGDDYRLVWKAVRVAPGNRAVRFVAFGTYGKGEFAVEASLLDAKGRLLARTVAEGYQYYGIFGGSFEDAIDEAATKTAALVRDHFGVHR